MRGLMNRSTKWIGVLALVLALAAFAGCASWFASDNGTPIDPNPVITGGISASVAQGVTGQSATFTVNASDPQGDTLTYAWDDGNAAAGTFTGAGASVNWVTDTPGVYTITVVVSDEDDNTDSATFQFTVEEPAPGNEAPVITALTVNNATPNPDEEVSLTATATDADGDTLTFTWDDGVGGGTFTGTGASVTYSNSTLGTYTITVTVSDGELEDSDTTTVEVVPVPNEAPVFEDAEGTPYVLEGDVSAPVATQRIRYHGIKAIDPDGDAVTYEWTANGAGAFTDISVDAEGFAEAYWAADAPGNYVVTLTADDGKGGTSRVSATAAIATDAFDVTDLPTEFDYVGYEGCACHPDIQTSWADTNHANAFEKSINVDLGHGFRNESCYNCHAVGQSPVGDGGFIDQELTPQFANIQCESCHAGGNPAGMGSGHKPIPYNPGIGYQRDADGNFILVDDEFQVDEAYDGTDGYGCGLCHEGSRHGAFEEWTRSKHAIARAWEEDEENPGTFLPAHERTGSSCNYCHNGAEFVRVKIDGEAAATIDDADYDPDKAIIGCATCHDPHAVTFEGQLRVDPAADVTIPWDDANIGSHGNGNTCSECHDGRRTRANYDSQVTDGSGHFGPHGNPQAPVLYGFMGADLGGPTTYETEHAHATMTSEGCVDCHMWSRGYISADEPHIWGHSLDPVIEACAVCHVGETDMEALMGGLQEEVQGLLDDFVAAWPAEWKDVSDPANPDLWNSPVEDDPETPEDETRPGPPLADPTGNGYREALWNYYLVLNDKSMGVHNPDFIRDLLEQATARVVDLNTP